MTAECIDYPWQDADWSELTKNREKTHHGLMLVGRSGIGKRELALKYAQFLLCENTACGHSCPCNDCRNCHLFYAGSHPDFHVITTESESVYGRCDLISKYSGRYHDVRERDRKAKPGKFISVEQIRKLIGHFGTRPHIAQFRVAMVLPADRMNINAANALLKLLEEPPENTIFLLVSGEPGRLPSTVRSRCIQHKLHVPSEAAGLQWLSRHSEAGKSEIALGLANGGPIDAKLLIDGNLLDLRQDCLKGAVGLLSQRLSAVDAAARFAKMDFEQLLIWLQQFVHDLIKWRQFDLKPQWKGKFNENLQNLSVERLYRLYDKISYYRRVARHPINAQLAIEDLLLNLQKTLI